ncbi:MAG: hypothetical protein ABWZ40_14505 [Caulobacterales bacterium]
MSWISGPDRDLYSQIADLLLPAFGALPAASDAGAAGAKLDQILGWRPELGPEIKRGLNAVRGLNALEAIQKLETEDEDAFTALKTLVLGAYFIDPEVMKALGYPGQESNPVSPSEDADYLRPGLLDAVKARGPIWRRPNP